MGKFCYKLPLINECSLRNILLNYEWVSDPNCNSLFDRSLIGCCFLSRDWGIIIPNYFLIFALPIKTFLRCFNNICWEEGVREEKKGERGKEVWFPSLGELGHSFAFENGLASLHRLQCSTLKLFIYSLTVDFWWAVQYQYLVHNG